jgi:hypothetical protein
MQLWAEAISDAPNGLQAYTEIAKLAAKPDHLGIHRAVEAVEIGIPKPLEEKIA